MSNLPLSRTSIRGWGTLLGGLLALTAALVILAAAINPALLGPLQHPRADRLVITGFLIVAMLAVPLLFPLYFEPADDDTDAYEPEATPDIPYAGTDIEPLTRHPLAGARATASEQDEIHDRLRTAAITMIHRHTADTRDEASARVDRGDWTQNAAAAWFLGETPPPRSIRFYRRLSDGLAFRHGARETIHEIVAYEQSHTGTQEDAT
ncbi:hypothetical protein SAMN05216388_102739 [Halorientalis persicus]|jgi:hypothetical protein|uniref:Uncharacterized protein n=1 Tax=Halorientalis persicus TaxID=1367881 RepID=A0A1H8UFK6_9EURY|nr:hypothetical protein [Halorientalis persicus]SEP02009.1 hypothetical protein SAMN05216388_102739 [Halorientalis persicus]